MGLKFTNPWWVVVGAVTGLFVCNGPVLGNMMDRWSMRRVALPGIVVYTIFLSLMGLAPAVLGIFTLMFALAEMTSAIQTPLGYAKAISAWFDRRRGLALGIAMSGVGLGAVSCRSSPND